MCLTHVRGGGCRGVVLLSAGITSPGVCHLCQVWQALRQRQAGLALQKKMADGMQHGIHCFSQFLQGRSPQVLFKGQGHEHSACFAMRKFAMKSYQGDMLACCKRRGAGWQDFSMPLSSNCFTKWHGWTVDKHVPRSPQGRLYA